ncbi:MAG: division plane positioning ATPase MipZ [Alphaproteobacteria bacterium]
MSSVTQFSPTPAQQARPHVIVVGNEKGGTGKSTTAMHLIVALLRDGYRVGAIDLDARQGTLSRYFDNRRVTAARREIVLPHPLYRRVARSELGVRAAAEAEEVDRLAEALAGLGDCQFVVIDTPGSDNALSRLGHSHADTLITPLNDSFVDLALLADVDPETHAILAPSTYAEMVWEQKKQRAIAGGAPIDWIVTRNRLSTLDSRNRRNMEAALDALARRIGFRIAPGFGERVIFRELYLLGLTLFDVREEGIGIELSMSHIAALQEVRALMRTIGLPNPEMPAAEGAVQAAAAGVA